MNTGREKIRKLKPFITLLVKLNSLTPSFLNHFLFVLFRNTPGYLGLFIRYIIFKNLSKKCGDNVSIHAGVYLKGIKKIAVGNNLSIHSMCYIDGSGGIKIGDNVSIAHACSIMSTNHTWENKAIPIKYNKIIQEAVIIDNDVWVGCGCRILSGTKISSRSIIAAGAVVNKNVDSNTIVGGIPAKFIKNI